MLGAVQTDYKGLIVVNKVMTRNLFKDIGTGLRSIVGGEVKNLSKLSQEMRRDLVAQAERECAELGANAVVGLRIETNSTFEGTVDMVLYGTAVWAKK